MLNQRKVGHKGRSIRRISILVLMLFALTGCQERFEWHEKLTVTVETPSGEVSGSAVVGQVSLVGQMPMAANAVAYEITGEATVVELGSGRFLFALLNGIEERAVRTFKTDDMKDPSQYFAAAEIARGAKPLVGPQPMLVTFEDIADPQSVKLVDPANLAATFGEGYALKSITLEITDEPVTEGKMEGLLPWLIDVGRDRPNLIANTNKFSPLSELTAEEKIRPSQFLTLNHWREE